jgi:RHS repeat-associated protein
VIRAQRAGVTLGSYVYNGLGQRVRKATAAGTRHFQYSPDGLLLGEYDGAGRTIQEYVYLDTMPLAILGDPAQAWRVFFAHSDHLDTLVKVTNGAGNLVWDAERRPFGETTLKLQQIQVPLRFPGQYHDTETGLYYNYFRDYDPSTGRYVQSDPIGLAGGLNTYAYAMGNPLVSIDPLGLATFFFGGTGSFQFGGVGVSVASGFGFDTSGQICFQVTMCPRFGPGTSAGVTGTFTGGEGNFCEGNSFSGGLFAEGGFGPFGGLSADMSSSGQSGTLSGRGGTGGGAAAGVQGCVTRTFCRSIF